MSGAVQKKRESSLQTDKTGLFPGNLNTAMAG